MNYLIIGSSSNHLEERNGLGSQPKIFRTKPSWLPVSQPIAIKSRQKEEKMPPGICPRFNRGDSFTEHTPQSKSECRCKHTCSGFATELTLQVIVIFSSPASNCSQSSPAVLKPRVHRKPCTISCDRNAISEARSYWAPPLHALSPPRSQSPCQVQRAPGLGGGSSCPGTLSFLLPPRSPSFQQHRGGVQCDTSPSTKGLKLPGQTLSKSTLERRGHNQHLQITMSLQMNLWREWICMRPFIKQIRERTNFQNTSSPSFVESWILFPMIYVGVLPKLLHEYILNYQLPHWTPGEGNGNPLQYSCLENSMDRGAWWIEVHGVAKSQPQLSN